MTRTEVKTKITDQLLTEKFVFKIYYFPYAWPSVVISINMKKVLVKLKQKWT